MENFWRAVAQLEKKRRSKIFCIIHHPQAVPDNHICSPTFSSVFSERSRFKGIETLELILHTLGGSADVAYEVIRFFRRKCKNFNVIVPLQAKSAGTLMCLGADKIYMGEMADLGPIDIQLGDPIEKGAKNISPLDEFKCTEFLRDYSVEVLNFFMALILRQSGMSIKETLHESVPLAIGIMRPLYEQLDPLEIGEYKRALAVGEEYAKRLLAMTKNPTAKQIIERLVWKYPSHEFAIDREEARSLGLPVYPLEPAQETLLISALDSILDLGESINGFPKIVPKKPKKAARPAPARRAVPAPRPVVAAAR